MATGNSDTVSPVSQAGTSTLTPDFRLPVIIIVLGSLLFFASKWVCAAFVFFGIFLGVQTVMLRLEFDDLSLKVYRQATVIREFPYVDWENWEIFWSPLPILFYFKEVKSIHFVPVIFDVNELKRSLETHVPRPIRR